MFIEFMSHVLSLDLPWIAGFILGNLHWVFALFAYVIIAGQAKKPVWSFLLLMGGLYAALDIAGLAGWIFVPLLIFLPMNLVISIFLEGTVFQKHATKILWAAFFVLAFINTFYFRFPG